MTVFADDENMIAEDHGGYIGIRHKKAEEKAGSDSLLQTWHSVPLGFL